MAGPRITLAVLLVALSFIALAQGMRGPGPRKCCFTFIDRKLPVARVVRYHRTSQQCSNPGVLLTTVADRQLCARPSAGWVKDIMRQLDAKVKAGEQTIL